MQNSSLKTLNDALRSLTPTGKNGFEGLIAALLSKLSGADFFLSASGRQQGRDMRGKARYGTNIVAECKRYRETTGLDERELIAELAQAAANIPDLDLWVLVASRDVSDQIQQSLAREADKCAVALLILQSEDSAVGRLAILCAAFPDIFLDFLPVASRAAVRPVLDDIRLDAIYAAEIERLKRELSEAWIGLNQARVKSHLWLKKGFSSSEQSRAMFLQHLAVTKEAQQRKRLLDKITAWYEKAGSNRVPLLLSGEEGDGKTWLVADWLRRRFDDDENCPITLFVQATHLPSAKPFDVIAEALNKVSEQTTSERWLARTKRWVGPESTDAIKIVLVFDGINEKFAVSHWRALFAALNLPDFRKNVLVILTCRGVYWDKFFRDEFGGVYERIDVPPFDDEELDIALATHGLNRGDLSPAIIPLMRKPRYFDITRRFRGQLSGSGDITVARLLYEDWRDRYNKSTRVNLSPDDFNDLLKRIASSAVNGERKFATSSVLEGVPIVHGESRQEILNELTTGGVFRFVSAGRIEIERSRLQMGLGFLLVDQLLDVASSDENLFETAAKWLEPEGIEEKAKIVEHAVYHSLKLTDCPESVRRALLEAWLRVQNRDDPEGRNFISYFPLAPDTFFSLAPLLWQTSRDLPWGQQLFLESVVRWRDKDSVVDVAVNYAEQWLGYVFTYVGEAPQQFAEGDHASAEAHRLKLREDLEAHLQGRSPTGSLKLDSFTLTFTNDEGLTRLGRVALAYISKMPRRRFAHALACAILAESVAPYYGKVDVIAWVIRTSPDYNLLCPAFCEEADRLSAIADLDVAISAAHRLLDCEGSSESLRHQKRLPKEPDEPESAWKVRRNEHEKDPCSSIFAATRAQCVGCLEREDINTFQLVSKVSEHWCDPHFPIPENFRKRMGDLLPALAPEQLWQSRGYTPAESNLEEYAPALAACNPALLADAMRKIFRTLNDRSPDGLWSACNELAAYSILFDTSIINIIGQCWETVGQHLDGQDLTQTEMSLFEMALPQWTASEQLDHFLARSPEAFDLRSFRTQFKHPSETLYKAMSMPEDITSQRRLAWFFAQSQALLESRFFNECVNHSESFIRGLAFKSLYRFGTADQLDAWSQGGWCYHFDMHNEERHWGSMALARSCGIAAAEAIARIDTASIFDFGEERQWDAETLQAIVERLRQWLTQARTNINVAALETVPDMKISDDLSAHRYDVPTVWLEAVDPDRTINFVTPTSLWGGMYGRADTGDARKDPFSAFDMNEWKARNDVVQTSVKTWRQRNGFWPDRKLSNASVQTTLSEAPDLFYDYLSLVASENGAVDQLIIGSYGLALAMLAYGLRHDPNRGCELYARMSRIQYNVTYRHPGVKQTWIDIELFKAPRSPTTVNLWEKKLELAKTNEDLLSICVLAHEGDSQAWLSDAIRRDASSAQAFECARSIMLAQMSGESASTFDDDTWLYAVNEKATYYRNHLAWAKEWYARFLSDSSNDVAFSSFTLLLECVDRRFWIWRQAIENACSAPVREERLTFIERNIRKLQKAIKENEKSARDTFLTMRVVDGQVWPWLAL